MAETLSKLIVGEEAERTVIELINRINRLRALEKDELDLAEKIIASQKRASGARVHNVWTQELEQELLVAANDGMVEAFIRLKGMSKDSVRSKLKRLRFDLQTAQKKVG